ncbi:protein DD3-3-like [Rhopilema esculentum]|uniref:protein DD3-3-like n=1 Tax=Rhopilema esculentum TaxID=499914 RepID=UPI0031E22F90|eukprot:gene9254-16942_t
MASLVAALAIICAAILAVNADMYLQNPRGSNNRLNERGRERSNANRLFDSQNNNRGGYNVGKLWYYSGSVLPIQWTNQHSCNGPNNNCEIIIQYMCSSKIRDGTQTRTIPDKDTSCRSRDCDKDLRYGMHEDFKYYETCKNRRRNKQLFTADQNLKGESARYTRQNPQGTRRGYECPEERDYYPYWSPTPWKDIAVLTNDVSRCDYYKRESQNRKSRWVCDVPETYLYRIRGGRKRRINGRYIPISQAECEQITGATWKEHPAHNIDAPDCVQAPWSRDNHNGNGRNGYMNIYNWTVPNLDEDSCAIRIRYNISTNDYDTWNTFSDKNGDTTKVDIAGLVGLSSAEAVQRGFVFKNNPVVNLFPGSSKLQLRLAINTAQYGRTFQDRSFAFAIMPRTEELKNKNIYNVNVRGKRGNIVQVYPAVEYDYVPNTLVVNKDDFVHFQWTGSNTNPGNNAGQGKSGTDRSNVILLADQVYPEGLPKPDDVHGQYGRNFPENIVTGTVLGLAEVDAKKLAFLQPGSGVELDEASVYFDLGPRKVTRSGTYFYMCTRNNNFTNRSQKGKIVVRGASSDEATEAKKKDPVVSNTVVKEDTKLSDSSATKDGIAEWATELDALAQNEKDATKKDIKSDANALESNVNEKDIASEIKMDKKDPSNDKITVEKLSVESGMSLIAKNGGSMDVGDGYASDFLKVYTKKDSKDDGKQASVELALKRGIDQADVTVYYSTDMKSWDAAERQDVSDGVARVKISTGGVYVARFSKSEEEKRAEQENREVQKQEEEFERFAKEEQSVVTAEGDNKKEAKDESEKVWSVDQ